MKLKKGYRRAYFKTVVKVTIKGWFKITLALIIHVFLVFMNLSLFFWAFVNNIPGFSTSQLRHPSQFIGLFNDLLPFLMKPEIMFWFFIFILITIILTSWLLYFSILISISVYKGENRNFFQILNGSFNYKLIRIALFFFLFVFSFFFLISITLYLSSYSLLLSCLFFALVSTLYLKFLVVMPSISIANLSLSEAFSFSFSVIDWKRALVYLIYVIIITSIFSLLYIVSYMVGLMVIILPFFGVLFSIILKVIIGGFLISFIAASVNGIFFKTSENLHNMTDNNSLHNIEDHLI